MLVDLWNFSYSSVRPPVRRCSEAFEVMSVLYYFIFRSLTVKTLLPMIFQNISNSLKNSRILLTFTKCLSHDQFNFRSTICVSPHSWFLLRKVYMLINCTLKEQCCGIIPNINLKVNTIIGGLAKLHFYA